ncbi:DUF2591 domain-containing protein [Vibrio cholerae]|uniref:Uncharacterized protein n=2 Tax=Vibrio TaxID=662 RepID=A0A1B1LRJ4_VIBPH|nr:MULTISPECIES: phage protein NinX family protein [Vibrio]ANS55678.1 hypothetical protein [Vibrio parahaemolyticus]EJL6490408.1 DUF2591 domain-containing protein [Vibrio cholerae]EJL6642099.1 DUF2591 domain-containing protein [Vibrio cholerae]MBL4244443.1 DUF2591 domain-containing protein [Vibrio fluvialis]MBL4253333.1 DUF2591 domain-containing protein [Vibrio fluvialis]
MSLVNVSTLEGAVLDWAVAKCQNLSIKHDPMGFGTGSEAGFWVWDDKPKGNMTKIGRGYSPSTNWQLGGPIADAHQISLISPSDGSTICTAYMKGGECKQIGNTLLIAAMRTYVCSVLGDELELPEKSFY